MNYRVLNDFAALFEGRKYNHRVHTNGDHVAVGVYEDLVALGRSKKYVAAVEAGTGVVSLTNSRPGVSARRGDGTFG